MRGKELAYQSAVNGKANASHTHTIAQVTNLQTTLNGKANTSHNHSASNITSGTLGVARGGTGVTTLNALKTLLGIDTSTQSINKIVTGSYIGRVEQYDITTKQTITINGLNNILAVIIFSVNRANGYPDTVDYTFNSFFGLSIKGMTGTGIVLNGNIMTVSGKGDINDPNNNSDTLSTHSRVYLNYLGSKYQYIAFGN